MEIYQLYDKLIFSVAYNMTGNYTTSQDVVQDINMKFLKISIDETVVDKKSYVIRATVNHCINLIERQKKISYVGTWLPEPITGNSEKTVAQAKFERRDLLSYELAFLMDQLSPTERAVFVLREAFGFDHKEIAEAINISTDNSRQLLKRAKEKVANRKHKPVSNKASLAVAKQFVQHISDGNLQALINLFNEDISILGDGGGKAPAIKQSIFGKEKVAQFLLNSFGTKNFVPIFHFIEILSQPAIAVYHNGKCVFVQVLSLNENKIAQVFTVLNPDKLSSFQK